LNVHAACANVCGNNASLVHINNAGQVVGSSSTTQQSQVLGPLSLRIRKAISRGVTTRTEGSGETAGFFEQRGGIEVAAPNPVVSPHEV
jgi:hypothetical protein